MAKFFYKGKDGGDESNVTGYWLFESKRFGSIVLLCFDKGSREAYHTHAFNAISWILKGKLEERSLHTLDICDKDGSIIHTSKWEEVTEIKPSLKPIFTSRERFHRVFGMAEKTWALSFRGPWLKTWKEFRPKEERTVILTNGRKEVK